MTVYAEACPDFYLKRFERAAYSALLQNLSQAKPNPYLYVTEQGLILTHVFHYIWENFKGCFGCENRTQVEKVNAEWLKFLHYGLMEGYFQQSANIQSLHTLKDKVSEPRVKEVMNTILDKKGNKLKRVQQTLSQYCKTYEKALRPALWNRLVWARTVHRFPLTFGETYLDLAQQPDLIENRVAYLYRAASPLFSLKKEYSNRLEACFNEVRKWASSTAQFGYVHLQMSERKYRQKEFHGVLTHLNGAKSLELKLSTYHRYLEFIASARKLSPDHASRLDRWSGLKTTCDEICYWFLQNPPAFPEGNQKLRSDFVQALITLGGYHLSSSESVGTRLKSFFGFTGQQKSSLEMALDCYTQVLAFSEGDQQQVIIQELWDHIDKMRKLKVDLETFRSTISKLALENENCMETAQQALVCLKCFSNPMTISAEWKEIATRFAKVMAIIFKNKDFIKHFVLLDLSLQLVKSYGKEIHYPFLEILSCHLSPDDLRTAPIETVWRFRNGCYNVGLHHQEQKEWGKAARHFLIYLQCALPDGEADWEDCCQQFAESLAMVIEDKETHDLLEQAILYHRAYKACFFKFLQMLSKVAFDTTNGPMRKAFTSLLCKYLYLNEIREAGINLENFRQGASELAYEYSDKQEWEKAASQFLLCIKCFSPEELAKSLEGAKLTLFFAKALGQLLKKNAIKQTHLNLLDQAINHRLKFTEENIGLYIKSYKKPMEEETWVFLVDQGCCLYYLRGCIREAFPTRYTKEDVLEDFKSAVAIAPKHPAGAYGYFFINDKYASPQDSIDMMIQSYRSCILEWCAGFLHL